MAATTDDASYGYHHFCQSGGTLALAEINDILLKAGRCPISQRMYRHYRRLLRHRHSEYMPINRLDVLLSCSDQLLCASGHASPEPPDRHA